MKKRQPSPEFQKLLESILKKPKYIGKTSDDIFPQTDEQRDYHLKRAEEKRQRKLNKKNKE